WHFNQTPVLSGTAFTETVGGSRLFGHTFSTAPLTAAVQTVTSGDNANVQVQRLIIQNATTMASVRYVTAFEVAPSSTQAMDATQQILSTDNRLEGTQIGADVVLFGRNGDVDPALPVTYSFNGAGSVQHLLTNMKAGQQFKVM